MKTMTPMIGAAALLLGTTASATVLIGPAVSGLNKANGTSATSVSKTVAVIDVDGDGLFGFNFDGWNGSNFLPDASDAIVFGLNGKGTWTEATGDGTGVEAFVPSPQKFGTLDVSTSPYEINVVSTASNTPAVVGGGDNVYLFFFPDLAAGAASPGANRSFGMIKLGALPDGFGLLAPNLLSPASDFRAFYKVGINPADLDQDGDIDDADFGISFAAFTGPNSGPSNNPAADLDLDGDVDDADFGISFSQFTGPGGPVSVPEPTSLALLGLGGLMVMRRKRA